MLYYYYYYYFTVKTSHMLTWPAATAAATTVILWPSYRSTCITCARWKVADFVGAKLYCLHVLVDSNRCI